jgi:hypothetical protein
MNKLKQAMINMNLFRTSLHEVDTDAHELRIQIISTRIYLTLLVATFCVVAVSIWQIPVTKIAVVNFPSYEKYSIMYRQYQQSLSCPCKTISIPYDKFINVEPVRFHQVCQSIYVTSNWSTLIDMSYYGSFGFIGDFRLMAGPMFTMLGSLCNQTLTAIADAIITFNANYFVTSYVMPVDQFEQQTQSDMDFLMSSIKSSFKNSLQLGRDMTQGNALFSAIVGIAQLNFTVDNVSDLSINFEYTNMAGNSSNCSCEQDTSCALPARILTSRRDGPLPIVRFTVPGLVSACYLVDSILQSNLICFYNQYCIDELITIMASPVVLNTVALSTTIPSQYKPDSTLGEIIDQLMVEQWIEESSHETYYAQCNPTTCSVSYEDNNNFIVVFSITMGIIGTLSILLKVIVPRAVRKLWSCCKNHNRVTSEVQNPSSAGDRPFEGTFQD